MGTKSKLTFIYIITVLFFTGCNPFGKYSLVNIFNPVDGLKNQITHTDLTSGGSPTLNTVPPVGHSNHLIELSIGNQYQQSTYVTSQGNSLEVIVIGIAQ